MAPLPFYPVSRISARKGHGTSQTLNHWGDRTVCGEIIISSSKAETEDRPDVAAQQEATSEIRLQLEYQGTKFDAAILTSQGEKIGLLSPDGPLPLDVSLNLTDVAITAAKQAPQDHFRYVCFTPGSLILTTNGLVPVEDLELGDFVITRDNGPQPLRWIGENMVPRRVLNAFPDLAPVLLKKNSVAAGVPARDMMVSPNHRLLLNDWRAETMFGTTEVLVPARALVNGETIIQVPRTPAGLVYFHLLFDQHEVIRADGIEAESFYPASPALSSLERAVQEEIYILFPNLMFGHTGSPARLLLGDDETRALLCA